jgi:SAM-dependent methyltransferase
MPPPMDQVAAIRTFFDTEAQAYLHGRERQHSFVVQRDLVLELLPQGCARVLDAGCGPAVMAAPLLERGAEVWGVDASARMIDLGVRRMEGHPLAARLHFRTGDLERLPYAGGAFDAAVAMGVLEYMPDRLAALAEIRRVMRPGGALVLTIPSCVSAYHLARNAWVGARTLARRALGRGVAVSERLATWRCVPWRLDRQLAQAGFQKEEGRFCNFIFFPLHELHAGASLALNRRLSGLGDTPLGAWLGAQYVVKAIARA